MSSIRARLTWLLSGGLLLLFGAGGAVIYLRTRSELARQDDAALLSKAWAMANALESEKGYLEVESVSGLERVFDRRGRPAFYEVWHGDAQVAARSPSLAGLDLPLLANTSAVPLFVSIELPDGRPGRAVGLRLHADAEAEWHGDPAQDPEHELTLVVADDVLDTSETLAALRTTLLAILGVSFLGMLGVVGFALRRGLAPLEAMARAAETIGSETLDRRFTRDKLPSELDPIRMRLNDLLERLQSAFDRERRFNAAVAHELRTPLAELLTLAEVSLRWPDEPRDPEAAGEDRNMSEVLAIAQQMQSLVDALLSLARIESGVETVERERVMLDRLVEDGLKPFRAKAEKRGLDLRCGIRRQVSVETHERMFRSIVSNLVANAVDHAPEGSLVEIEAHARQDQFRFSIANPAPELTDHDLPHLFDAFWRKDAARTDGRHCGLGLALTDALAKALGYRLRAEKDERGRLHMILEGPCARD